MSKSIGAIDFKSIAKGIEVADEMVKKADVDVLYLKTICPGRFLVILTGDEGAIIDSCIINSVHNNIIQALKSRFVTKANGAIGVMETNSVSSGLKR